MNKKLKLLSANLLETYSSKVSVNWMDAFRKLPKSMELNKADFKRFITVASVTSSQIEGSTIDVNSFFNKTKSKNNHEIKDINNLISAYNFAAENKLTKANFLKAHTKLSKNFLEKIFQGKVRKKEMFVVDRFGNIVYVATPINAVNTELSNLFTDITTLLKRELSYKEAFYYSSQIHFWFVKIHPFIDGNGRAGRLLEKWFLSQIIGSMAWSVPAELYYWENRPAYYANLAKPGTEYENLNPQKSIDFLLMLPKSLALK